MSLKERLLKDMKEAMKSKDSERLGTIRFLQSAVKNREIELRPEPIDDQEIIKVIRKMVKQRQDSIEQFEKAERNDLAQKEKSELDIIEVYLPAQLSEDQVKAMVEQAIKDLGATGMKDMGAVMKQVQEKTGGAADNRLVSTLVKSQLQGS